MPQAPKNRPRRRILGRVDPLNPDQKVLDDLLECGHRLPSRYDSAASTRLCMDCRVGKDQDAISVAKYLETQAQNVAQDVRRYMEVLFLETEGGRKDLLEMIERARRLASNHQEPIFVTFVCNPNGYGARYATRTREALIKYDPLTPVGRITVSI